MGFDEGKPKTRIDSLRKYDVFRTMPRDLVETTSSGAVLTLVACFFCAILFLFEFTAFLRVTPVTEVVMDSNQEGLLKIKFDLTMHDIACDHIFIGAWDSFGTDRLNITKGITMTPVGADGVSTEGTFCFLDIHFSFGRLSIIFSHFWRPKPL